jgi:hypothetical protein
MSSEAEVAFPAEDFEAISPARSTTAMPVAGCADVLAKPLPIALGRLIFGGWAKNILPFASLYIFGGGLLVEPDIFAGDGLFVDGPNILRGGVVVAALRDLLRTKRVVAMGILDDRL